MSEWSNRHLCENISQRHPEWRASAGDEVTAIIELHETLKNIEKRLATIEQHPAMRGGEGETCCAPPRPERGEKHPLSAEWRQANKNGARPLLLSLADDMADALDAERERADGLEGERDEARAKIKRVADAMEPYLIELCQQGRSGIFATDAVALLIAERDAMKARLAEAVRSAPMPHLAKGW